CYLMGDELRHLWSLGTRGQAIALVMDWIHRATHSRIKPLVDFGKNLRGYVQGIIAAADFKINTSVLEGVNNKIKQIKRRAYGKLFKSPL
ncbi:MAG: transposase, partial [Sutterella wadsworthensis]|nr:transposase [Sutterella wadsworthensis]